MAASSAPNEHGAPNDGGVHAAAEETPLLAVLTVGDGNFSFSLAFLKQQQQRHGDAVRLVATSFDSYDELVEKYPESARICAQLRELGAVLLHRVDATNLQVSLRNAAVAAGVEAEMPPRFHRVIFNHPHCGEENVARHQSLLSHFFVSAQRLLKAGSGRIHLTLAHGQPERWEARERAEKARLVVAEEVQDVDAHVEYAVSYERKRHQNGKSFHRVLLHGERLEQASTLFVMALAANEKQWNAGLSGDSRKRKASMEAGPAPVTTPARASSVAAEKATVSAAPVAVVTTAFECGPCEKSFKTAQGLKTHVHMVHKLGVAGAAPTTETASRPTLPCGECERTFKNEDARRQHQISKHGTDGSIRPDWFTRTRPSLAADSANATATQPGSSSKTCSICGLSFADGKSFDAHWQELQPKTVTKRACALCGRAFEEERALRQHQNFCRAKAEAEAGVASSR